MRSLLLLVILAAGCDLQPPKKKPPTTQAADPAALPPNPPDEQVPPDAGVAVIPDAMEPTLECTAVGTRIATTIIEEAKDPAQKAALEQERGRIIRRTAEACTADQWPEPARQCFLKAATTADMQVCGKDLAAPKDG